MVECKKCGMDHSIDPSPFEKLGIDGETIDPLLRSMFKQMYDFVGAELNWDDNDPMLAQGQASKTQLHAINELMVTLNANFILSTCDTPFQTLQLHRLQKNQQDSFIVAGLELKYGAKQGDTVR